MSARTASIAILAPSIFLSVAAFLLNVVLSRVISTQREEIAALKAFGYSKWEVGWHFLKFVLVITVSGVAAGVLLIVLIFTMLASERRAEMGMERAVGTQRPQLIQQFVAEGSGYALVAGLVGAALGVLAAIGIAQGMKVIFGAYAPVEPHITPRSMVVAYCLGMVITFLAVAASSWKVSRINVVAAIRAEIARTCFLAVGQVTPFA